VQHACHLVAGVSIVHVHWTSHLLTHSQEISRMRAAALETQRTQYLPHGIRRTGEAKAQLIVQRQRLQRVVRHHSQILAENPSVTGYYDVLIVPNCHDETHSTAKDTTDCLAVDNLRALLQIKQHQRWLAGTPWWTASELRVSEFKSLRLHDNRVEAPYPIEVSLSVINRPEVHEWRSDSVL